MKLRCTTGRIVAIALVVLGCSSGDDQSGTTGAVTTCTPGEVVECACADGSMAVQTCNTSGGFDACTCESGAGGAVTGTGGVVGVGTGGTVVGTGGTVVLPGTGGVSGQGGVGTGGTVVLPGTGGDPGQGGVGGGPILTASDPVIPPVNGACPTFMNQTLDFMSLRGIQMQAGPQSNGTGMLLFYWHGTGSNSGEVGIVPLAAQQTILNSGGIIISPQSSTGATMGVQASGTSVWFDEDLTTADQIVACAVSNYGIDPRRIYATGCSAGGLMTGYMASQRSEYMAAVAPNSGGYLGQGFSSPHIPPVMTMHGLTGVDVVILDFAQRSLLFDSEIVAAGGFAVDCDHGGGHCGVPGDLYAAGMQFLFDHPFGLAPEPYESGLPVGFPGYCVIQ